MQNKSINRLNLDDDPIPSEPMICYASWLILQKNLSIRSQNSSEHQDVGTEQEREQVARQSWPYTGLLQWSPQEQVGKDMTQSSDALWSETQSMTSLVPEGQLLNRYNGNETERNLKRKETLEGMIQHFLFLVKSNGFHH